MATDSLYLDPLLHFKRLITYANVKDDPVINYGNAALAYKDLCPKEIQKRYKDHPKPHIFHHDPESVVKDDLPGVNKAKMPDEMMMDRLSSLPWIRYGIIPVCFSMILSHLILTLFVILVSWYFGTCGYGNE